MEARERLRNVVGFAALAATLALASPGVNVRAEPAVASGEPNLCESSPQVSADAEAQALVSRLRHEHMARTAARDVVVLNGRGYNYGPPPTQDLDRIRAEAAKNRR